MGGIKNRDAKRAAAKVFSSGGGGCNKGPASLDKRGQELQCPHCDRIFKQSGRLQDHFKKQHSQLATQEAPETDTVHQPAVSKGTTVSSISAKAPEKPPAQGTGSDKIMLDVGSRGGYYDMKSPKLLLHEWLLRDKQPRARYKTLPAQDGSWLCKVVLPHARQADKDIVIFLPEAHAASTEEDAAQSGAVAALHHIAGDRSLERTLPPQYVPLWLALGRTAERKAAQEAATAQRRAAKQAAQQAALKRRGPATVIMAEDKRKLVEGIIAEARLGGSADQSSTSNDGWKSYGRPDGDAGAARTVESLSVLIEELVTLGFGEDDAVLGATAVAGTNNGATLSTVLDWLCLNTPEGRLPSKFAPGPGGKPISVVVKGLGFKVVGKQHTSSQSSTTSWDPLLEDPAVSEITKGFGFGSDHAAEALQRHGGAVDDALRSLCAQLEGYEKELKEDFLETHVDMEDWDEERTALEAIFGADGIKFPTPDRTVISSSPIRLEGNAAIVVARHCGRPKESVMMDGVTFELHAWAPRFGKYPNAPPVVAVCSSDLPAPYLLALTRRVAAVARDMVGAPMLFELMAHAVEVLPSCLGNGADNKETIAPAVVTEAKATAEKLTRVEKPALNGAQGPTRRRQPAPWDVAAENKKLMARSKELATDPKHEKMRGVHTRLPAFTKRAEIVDLLQRSPVVVISGATGCGKSTQVPQYILEEAIAEGHGAECNIVVTQPRRISAIGLAGRVAAERNESVGDVVGYAVRLDSKQSRRTRLLFCTTGILLRRLLSDPTLQGPTHVVLDEVHERSIESDLLLMLLRRVLVSGANPGLRVVLMSATADADLFARYFAHQAMPAFNDMVLTIPGFTHPVADYYLEDALEATGMVIGKNSKWARKKRTNKSGRPFPESEVLESDDIEDSAIDEAPSNQNGPGYSLQTVESLRNVDESLVNYDLIESLVAYVVAGKSVSGQGKRVQGVSDAILVFAPGAEEIGRIVRTLQSSSKINNMVSLLALPLHGGLPPSQQAKVFNRPPPGVFKVVVATNVAETSITIDDITVVIDCGRAKELRHDPVRGIARLAETWISQASAQQRRGRAGRVRPGTCYRLFSREMWGRMAKDTPPEVARAPLESLIMDVKGILSAAKDHSVDAHVVLAEMITPPDPDAVSLAVQALQRVGALDSRTGALTPLGKHLTRMPCDPRTGKMLIFGAMLRCVDPILTVAAAQGHGRPVFWSLPDARDEAARARGKLMDDTGVSASKSDHLAVVAAFNGWRAALSDGGRSAAAGFCAKFYVSDQAMDAIHAGRRHYAEILADLGFVPPEYASVAGDLAYRGSGSLARLETSACSSLTDQYASNARVVKAVLAAGLYPQLLRVEHPATRYQKVLGGAVETEGEAAKVRFFDRQRGRVFLHPSSVNFGSGRFESGWLVYSEVVETSKVFVRESSMVPVWAVLLFGGEVSVHHEEGLVRIDNWATFKAPARIAVLVRELRAEVAALLERKVSTPEVDLGSSRVVEAMHHVLATDGF